MVFFLFVPVFSGKASGQSTEVASARDDLLAGLRAGCADEYLNGLRAGLIEAAAGVQGVGDSPQLEDLILRIYCIRNLTAFQGSDTSPEVWDWLFNSDERVRLVAGTLAEEDDASAVSRIIKTLYSHDPKGRDRYFDLILALAVVWDTPRKEMHTQIGTGWQKPDEDICRYYDYFKKLYDSTQSKVPYSELSVDSLIFVTTVP